MPIVQGEGADMENRPAKRLRTPAWMILVMFWTTTAVACSSAPSYTAQECQKLVDAVNRDDQSGIQRVLREMSDPGTEEHPHAVDPDIYADVLLLGAAQGQGSNAGVRFNMAALVRDCHSKLDDQASPASASSQTTPSEADLARAVKTRFEALIDARNLPYTVRRVSFEVADAKMLRVGRPAGTWLWVEFADPFSRPSSLPAKQLLLIKPLQLYRDAVGTYLPDLSFVRYYMAAFDNGLKSTFEIPPDALKAYVAGDITDAQMTHRIIITQLK
jgi:hypothetical protein